MEIAGVFSLRLEEIHTAVGEGLPRGPHNVTEIHITVTLTLTAAAGVHVDDRCRPLPAVPLGRGCRGLAADVP
jgi:hypothetical protein